ncbi:MAG: type II toxin-antitoxin system HipA family toxin [Bacteroidales bacterium]
MTKLSVKVSIWGKEVAAMVWDDENEYSVLEFFPDFEKEDIDLSPLMIPLEDLKRGDRIYYFPTNRNNTFKGLPGLIADSLPDDYGNQIIDEWFASKGLTHMEFNSLDRLCYIGKRAMGALEFEPSNHDVSLDESSLVEISYLTELAREVLGKRKVFRAELMRGKDKSLLDILKVGTSAGGAKPKAVIATNEDMSEVRSGQVKAPKGFSYWLLKFDGLEAGKVSDNPMGIGRIEYAYYKMALDCEITMTECRLFKEGEHAHFMTKRFDRSADGEKFHIQTLCGLAHYNRDDRHSYEQVFQLMRRLGLSYVDIEQFYRRMIFNIVSRNHDDHTKNHSFILKPKEQWQLAPAYDLCYSYSSTGRWTMRHQMSANNKREDFTYSDLLTIGKNVGIKNAKHIIEQVVEVVSTWNTYASACNVSKQHKEHIGRNLRLLYR